MLVKATEEHNYEAVEISILTGLFRKTAVKMTETKIRVNKSILGESIMVGGVTKALALDEVVIVANTFNEVRIAAGYEALVFRVTEDIKKEKNIIKKLMKHFEDNKGGSKVEKKSKKDNNTLKEELQSSFDENFKKLME